MDSSKSFRWLVPPIDKFLRSISLDLTSNMSMRSQSVLADDEPVLRSRERRVYERVLKRAIDLAGTFVLLCLLSPVILLVVLLIWISDGLPVFYLRRVIGARGEFDAYKFRTMCRDADARLQADPELRQAFAQNFKLRSDPRVTRVGGWLRKYSLDELPQLVNVLRGQMALVGPRMITAQELCKYGEHQDLLMSVKPGLTGYWQVRGRQDVSYEERVRMDIYYITHWTLGLDLKILLETPWKVVHSEGAY